MKSVIFFLACLATYAVGGWRYYGAKPSTMVEQSLFADGKIYAFGYPDYLAVGTDVQALEQFPVEDSIVIGSFVKSNNAYYIISSGTRGAYRSTDLKTWASLPFSKRNNENFASFKTNIYGNSDSVFRYSKDGLVWDSVFIRQQNGKALVIDKIWDDEKTVFVKVPGDSIFTSTDFKTWSYKPQTCVDCNYNSKYMEWVEWVGTKFIGIPYADSIIYQSTDGINWVSIDTLQNSRTYRMSVHNGKVLVKQTEYPVGSTSRSVYRISSDGKTWTESPYGEQTIFTGSGWYSSNGMNYSTSADGVIWSGASVVKDQGTGQIFSAIWDGSKYYGATASGISTSSDAVTWTQKSTTTGIFRIYHDGPMWIGFGNNGRIFSSTDGAQWTERTSNTSQPLSKLRWNGDHYIVEGNNVVLRSPDGITWDSLSLSLSRVWDGSKYYMAGGQYLITSTDGVDLDTIVKFADKFCGMYCIWYPGYIEMSHDSLFMFSDVPSVSGSGSSEEYISPDRGVTWTDTVYGPSFITKTRKYGNYYLATNAQPAHTTMVMVSKDFVKWDTLGITLNRYAYDFAFDGDSVTVFMVGNLWAKHPISKASSAIEAHSLPVASIKYLQQKGGDLYVTAPYELQNSTLTLYDLMGEKSAMLWSGTMSAGQHQFPLHNNRAGVYVAKLVDKSTGLRSSVVVRIGM